MAILIERKMRRRRRKEAHDGVNHHQNISQRDTPSEATTMIPSHKEVHETCQQVTRVISFEEQQNICRQTELSLRLSATSNNGDQQLMPTANLVRRSPPPTTRTTSTTTTTTDMNTRPFWRRQATWSCRSSAITSRRANLPTSKCRIFAFDASRSSSSSLPLLSSSPCSSSRLLVSSLLSVIVVLAALSNLSTIVAVASNNMPNGNQAPAASLPSLASASSSQAPASSPLSPTAAINSQSAAMSTSTPPASGIGGAGSVGNPRARYKTMYACEDRQLTMDCDSGMKINLIRANFGRFSITQCNEQGQLDLSTDCMSPITFRIMQDRCQDKQKCSVNATSLIFGDRCPKTRKYLEVHFQCQPLNVSNNSQSGDYIEKVDLRRPVVSSGANSNNDNQPLTAPITTGGSSPILPPNNPSSSSGRFVPSSQHQEDIKLQQQQQPQPIKTVINSEIMSFNMADNYYPGDDATGEPILVTMRHTHIDNMSNPRCFNWDSRGQQWTQSGSRLVISNQTHTICAFDQPTSYVLVMDYLGPLPTISQQPNQNSNNPINNNNNNIINGHHHMHAQAQPAQPPVVVVTQPPQGPAIPGMLDEQPQPLDVQFPPIITMPNNRPQQQQQQSNSSARFLSLFGYLLASVFVVIALMTIAFIMSSMRSSAAGQRLKSFGNFTAFNYNKRAGHPGHRHDSSSGNGTLHSNKDLLVINNQNGHQFLYAPASTTKISGSSSGHMLSGGQGSATLAPHHFNNLHHLQQRMYSDNGATLSNLSAAGAQSNNYYYGLMGLTSLFQHQQQQHHFSPHHLQNQQPQQQQQQQQQHQAASYNHQANKSTISNESTAHSSSSSSGVESGSTSMQQTKQATCLVTANNANNDYNLIGHLQQQQQQQQHYGHHQAPNFANIHQQHHQPQPTLTLNAHYSTSGGLAANNNNLLANQLHNRQLSGGGQLNLREHIYECVDDDKPYMAHLLLPVNNNDQQQQFSTNTLGHQQQVVANQQMSGSRTMTLSSRLFQEANNNNNNKAPRPNFHQPAIIRDNQSTKTNIICSKLAQVTPQRATEIVQSKPAGSTSSYHHDVMTIFNGNDSSTTTTTTATANGGANQEQANCFGRLDLGANSNNHGKLSTDC